MPSPPPSNLTTPTPPTKRRSTPKAPAAFHWTAQKEQALWLIFAGELSLEAVALNVAVASRTVDRWVAHPAFKQRLDQMRADLAASLNATIYVSKESRLLALADMAQKARREFEKRPWLKEVRPMRDGGSVTNEHFNSEAHSAFRASLDDIAKELGQRKHITELSGKDGGPIAIIDPRALLDARLAALAERQGAEDAAEQSE